MRWPDTTLAHLLKYEDGILQSGEIQSKRDPKPNLKQTWELWFGGPQLVAKSMSTEQLEELYSRTALKHIFVLDVISNPERFQISDKN